MKTVNISHFDLGGVTCAMFLRKAFGNITTYMIGYDDIEETLKRISDDCHVIITDINLNGRNIDGLKNFQKVTIIDHHLTTIKFDEQYDVIIDTARCGAWLTYEWLVKERILPKSIWFDEWAKYVDDHDRWIHQYPQSKQINAYLHVLKDKNKFIAEASGKTPNELIADNLTMITEYIKLREAYVKETYCYDISEGDDKVGVVFADRNASDVGDYYVRQKNFDLVYIINLGNGRVSLRSKIGGVNSMKVAEKFGGGGHQASAGFLLSRDMVCPMIGALGLRTKNLPRRKIE